MIHLDSLSNESVLQPFALIEQHVIFQNKTKDVAWWCREVVWDHGSCCYTATIADKILSMCLMF